METLLAIDDQAAASSPLLPPHSRDPDEERPSTSSISSDAIPRSSTDTQLPQKLKRAVPRFDSLDFDAMQFSALPYSHSSLQEQNYGMTLYWAFQAIGILYSDIGTSPLYVFTSAFHAVNVGVDIDILGSLSIIIYTLTLLPLLKYFIVVRQSNSNVEDDIKGGAFSLYSLICRYAKVGLIPNRQPEDDVLSNFKIEIPTRGLERAWVLKEKLEKNNVWKTVLLIMALLGASFVMENSILTPCISVTAAVSGLQVGIPTLSQDMIVGVTIGLLVFLFGMQCCAMRKIGFIFAPIMSVWFFSLAAIGIYNIMAYDSDVFRAINPMFIYYFFQKNGSKAWNSLGALVLCITGGELMFADLGKFPARSIEIAFSFMIYPCLLLTYIGQAAYLMANPHGVNNVFYNSIPGSLLWPMLLLATSAALIASRSVILVSFSVIKMAVALDCFPRVKLIHTSRRVMGQIYIPVINHLFMVISVIITAFLRETHMIAHAYGITILGDMLVTTAFVTLVMVLVWQTPLSVAFAFVIVIGAPELVYFLALIMKFAQGGWITVVLAFVLVLVMYIWHYGTKKKYQSEVEQKMSMDYILELGANLGTLRVPGIGLLYNELVCGVPAIFGYFMKSLPAIHSVIVFVCIKYVPIAVVPQTERFLFRRVGPHDYHLFRCVVRYGYKDVHKEHPYTFEQLLLQSLETFVQKEAREYALEFASRGIENGNDIEKTELTPSPQQCLTLGTSILSFSSLGNLQNPNSEMLSDCSFSDIPSAAPSSSNLNDDAVMELKTVRDTEESGVVYLLGHADVRAKKQSWFLKKLVINYLYSFLSRNCQGSSEVLAVPHTRLIQVGMTYMV